MKIVLAHSILIKLLAGCALFVLTASIQAEEVRVPVGLQASDQWTMNVPRRGMNTQRVLSEFGEPESQDGPRGEPPISYWEYPDFTVYFESSTVIHTVLKHRVSDQ